MAVEEVGGVRLAEPFFADGGGLGDEDAGGAVELADFADFGGDEEGGVAGGGFAGKVAAVDMMATTLTP